MNEQSEWTGFSIELWQLIAKNLELEYKFRENIYFSDMIERVKNENYDLAVANISVTSEREKHIDFSQPIYDS
jgi:ABC-type amino acid transport substrate-binding protein